MGTTKINISLDDSVADILTRVGNRSGYIARAVEARWREWQRALGLLASQGWARGEVLAVCDATNGLYHDGPMRAPYMQAELEDASRIEGLVEKWEVDVDAWKAKIDSMNDEVADALWTISREWWMGNEELRAKIEHLG